MLTTGADGLIGGWGVSNLDADDLDELAHVPGGETPVVTDQVLYNLTRRGPEFGLVGACRAACMSVMAYSPLEQARLFRGAGAGTAHRDRRPPRRDARAGGARLVHP